MANCLICYEEKTVRKWDMIKDIDRNAFLLELMQRSDINLHSIFIIPTELLNGIWLWHKTHKSSRVDFWNFYEDYGMVYKEPVINETTKKIMDKRDAEQKEKISSKYGFISPDGRYFHCDYQGHSNLADKICFGMVDTNNAERYLEEHGWCKIYKSLFNGKYDVYVGGNYVLTDEQMKTLIKMDLDKAESVSKMLCKRR